MTKRLRSSNLSLKDIADELGISVMTVSYALRPRKPGEKSPCSAKTAERVQRAAARLGYTPNRVARAMRTRQTGVIGFVAPHFSMEAGRELNLATHAQPFMAGLVQALNPEGLHVAMTGVSELEIEQSGQLPIALRERFFDALVVHYGLSPAATRLIEKHRIPVIYWDSGVFAEHNCINRDELKAGRNAALRLIELGHTRIALGVGYNSWRQYQAGQPLHYSYGDRLKGFTSAMEDHGLKPCFLESYNPESLANQIRKARVTALIWQTPHHLVTMKTAELLGKKIPNDLSTLICDLDPRIHMPGDETGGVLYDRFEVGRTVGNLLIKRMESGESVPSVCVPADTVLDGQNMCAIGRKSTGRAAARSK